VPRQPAVPDEREAIMPLIQGGPPETVYELRVQCGLEIMWLEFFTAVEVRQLASLLTAPGRAPASKRLRSAGRRWKV
jgi:hypothetical protein